MRIIDIRHRWIFSGGDQVTKVGYDGPGNIRILQKVDSKGRVINVNSKAFTFRVPGLAESFTLDQLLQDDVEDEESVIEDLEEARQRLAEVEEVYEKIHSRNVSNGLFVNED